jgi:hypothetical protein
MKPEEIRLGGIYRVTGRGLKHKFRAVVRERVLYGVRYVSWKTVDGKNSGAEPDASFAARALERVS